MWVDMSFEIDPVKYGVLWQKVENYEAKFEALEKKIDKMEGNIEKLLENQAHQKGAGWLAIGMLSVLSTVGGWFLHWWTK
jgi:response regulator of citrate/malate metabolism